jgi:hypothetical protein
MIDTDFETVVEHARWTRDAGETSEDWNSNLGVLCVEFAVDFTACSRCTRAIGEYVWSP